jgi:glyoxylase-like metal-dependent hydrolase (beta-lactamase superfamily II)
MNTAHQAPHAPQKAFASQADLEEKKVSFTKLSDNAYAYTAEGDPNTGVIVGDDAVMVLDTQATPVMAQDVIRRIREVTDKPIRYVLLTHYHAVRVLGASAYQPQHVIARTRATSSSSAASRTRPARSAASRACSATSRACRRGSRGPPSPSPAR